MADVRPAHRVWLQDGTTPIFGSGVRELLLRTEATGSLHRAAAEMDMAYSKAWTIVRRAEEHLGISLLARRVGGAGGGGSTLSEPGRRIVDAFGALSDEVDAQLEALYARHFGDVLGGRAPDPARGGSDAASIKPYSPALPVVVSVGPRRLTGTIAPPVDGAVLGGGSRSARRRADGPARRLRPGRGNQRTRSVRSVRVAHIPKNQLMLIAGLVWCAAGAMVCVIGLPLEFGLAPTNLILLPLAVGIFAAFYVFVFSRLVRKHTGRIRARAEDRLPFWHFFNASSWAVMAVMMGGGMALRLSHLLPDWTIAFFYSGLGVALFLCGVRFLGVFARKDVLALAPDPSRADA